MALISEIHLIAALDIANEIYDPIMIFMVYLTRVVTHKGLDECLRARFNFTLAATSKLLATYSSPFTHLSPLTQYRRN